MNPLLHAENGELYNADCQLLAKVKFSRSTTSLIVILAQPLEFALDERVYLMPEGKEHDYSSFLCHVAAPCVEYHVENTGATYYLLETSTRDDPSFGVELRVEVSFQIQITLEGSTRTVPATVKDISAGGLKIISNELYEEGSVFSFIFTVPRNPVILNAKIIRKRPSRHPGMHCYGCQFYDLSAGAENAVRKFVYTEDLLKRRRG